MKDNSILPIIDYQLGLKLAANQSDLANKMLTSLADTLPNEIIHLKKLNETHQTQKLKEALHKLHGAVSYCGVPRLKQSIISLEKGIKEEDNSEIPFLFKQLETEINLLLKQINLDNPAYS